MNSNQQPDSETVNIHLEGLPQDVGDISALLHEHFEVLEKSADEPGEKSDSVRRSLKIEELPAGEE